MRARSHRMDRMDFKNGPWIQCLEWFFEFNSAPGFQKWALNTMFGMVFRIQLGAWISKMSLEYNVWNGFSNSTRRLDFKNEPGIQCLGWFFEFNSAPGFQKWAWNTMFGMVFRIQLGAWILKMSLEYNVWNGFSNSTRRLDFKNERIERTEQLYASPFA